eukprot:49583_1
MSAMGNSSSKSKPARTKPQKSSRSNPFNPSNQISIDSEVLYFAQDDEKELYPRMTDEKSQCVVDWDKRIVGQKDAKQSIEFAFFLPRKFPSFFKNEINDENVDISEVEVNRTFLLWGPPGTGKTLLASSVATNHGAKFAKISPADILNKWVGGAETNIKELFDNAKLQKTIILLDEIDAYGRKRQSHEKEHVRTQKTQLLTSIEDFERNMSVDSALIACTNHIDELDPALKRRFKDHIFCGLPNEDEREQLFRMFCGKVSNYMTNMDFQELAKQSYLYSGSDISNLVGNAKQEPAAELQRAQYFLPNDNNKWLPATVDHQQAQRLQLKDLEFDSLAPKRPLQIEDVLKALDRRNPTISQAEYDAYLRHVKKNSSEITKEIKKTKYERDIDDVFKPHSVEELDMGQGRIFKQYERYHQKVTDPKSKFMINIQATQIGLIIVMVFILMIYPVFWWGLLWLLALFMLMNHVLLPIFMLTWQQFIKNDESNETLQNSMMSHMVGLIIFVFVAVKGTTFFVYSYKVIDICIEWLFLYLAINNLSVTVNFGMLYCAFEKISFSTPPQKALLAMFGGKHEKIASRPKKRVKRPSKLL